MPSLEDNCSLLEGATGEEIFQLPSFTLVFSQLNLQIIAYFSFMLTSKANIFDHDQVR